ncbi:unnamed protein product [Gulo gulo]|uniref:60S ribosomal protein L7a n=1 Tax=Gulo gulo TaxID=48420 RepID=A0A9X9M8X4_GULGU|nr:unnamed protein product [Gulo gulo]
MLNEINHQDLYSNPQEDLHHCCLHTVNLEDKGVLAKLVKAIKTNSNDRYGEIFCVWGGNTLGPKLVVHIATVENAKAKELATKLG